ncbi:hypothetical protein M569_08263 [Genlisea aurea]|uniref:FAF domain-containing protein n=1 Tax=Genlisea aurea TaxID=192259 RepID=S8CNX8_9LAMI|nr:hypothetical protein M569_08263 [Genlisea aurea]
MLRPDLVECMGAESALDFKPDIPATAARGEIDRPRKAPERRKEMLSIPTVAREERTPRVMKKYVTGDGRLVIREENVRNNGYLQVVRTDGRLVLNLIPLCAGGDENESESARELSLLS